MRSELTYLCNFYQVPWLQPGFLSWGAHYLPNLFGTECVCDRVCSPHSVLSPESKGVHTGDSAGHTSRAQSQSPAASWPCDLVSDLFAHPPDRDSENANDEWGLWGSGLRFFVSAWKTHTQKSTWHSMRTQESPAVIVRLYLFSHLWKYKSWRIIKTH